MEQSLPDIYSFYIINMSLMVYSTLKSTLIQQPLYRDRHISCLLFIWILISAQHPSTTDNHCTALRKSDLNHTHTKIKTEKFTLLCCKDIKKYFCRPVFMNKKKCRSMANCSGSIYVCFSIALLYLSDINKKRGFRFAGHKD